ncbi:MAG: caspase, EACC1-associated type, partial [Anaerolineales bacterium]
MAGKYALVIGNSEYLEPKLAKLVKPGQDARGLAEVLLEKEIGGFDEVKLLLNEPEVVIRRAISRFFTQKNRSDLLLLYFSGHGVLDDEGQLYFAVRDTEHDALTATAISSNFVRQEMNRSYSRRQVLILDCCNSGSFGRSAKGLSTSVGAVAQFEVSGYGRAVLTASDSLQYAWEDNDFVGQADYSVFTHFLIEGLKTGAADNEGDADGQTALDELFDYARTRMRGINARQTPTLSVDKLTDPIILARNPKPPAPKPVALPAELQQTLDDPRPWVREGGVAELNRLLTGSQPKLAAAAHEALQRLTADDSRRVADAAAKALAAHLPAAEPSAAEQQAELERFGKEYAEKLRATARRLEEQQKAHEAELANRKAKEEAERLAAEREARKPQPAAPQAEDRRAVERAEGEGMVVHAPIPSVPAESEPAPQAQVETEVARTQKEEAARLAAEREAKKPQQVEDRRAIERAEGEGMIVHAPSPSAPTPPAPGKPSAREREVETGERAPQSGEREAPKLDEVQRRAGTTVPLSPAQASLAPAPQPALEALLTPAEDRRAIERAEGEGMLASLPQPVVEPRLPASVAAWLDKPWFPLALLTVGWGAAMFIAQFTWWILTLDGQDSAGLAYSLILGFLGGTVTWFSLRASTSTGREIPPVLIIGLWVVTTLLGLWLYPLLQDNGIGIDESVAVERAILGAVGGIGTSVVLYRTGRMVNSQRAVIIGVGWAMAWLVSAWLGLSLINLFGDDAPSEMKESLTSLGLSDDTAVMLVSWVYSLIHGLEGTLAGLIGGWVMLRQLRRDTGEESVQTELLANVQRPMEAASRERNQTTLDEKSLIETIPGLAVWAEKPWFPLAMMSLGWALAFFIGTSLFWSLYQNGQELSTSRFGELLVLGLAGGAATWLALRAVAPKGNELPPLLIIGGWVAITLVGVWLNP